MRHSPLRHPLAILRQIIGLGQKELGDLVNRSPRTIQSVELGRHALSEELAHRIAHETGVAYSWLADANPQVQPWVVGAPKLPYQKHHFELTRALLAAGKEPSLFDIVTENEAESLMSKAAWEEYKEEWSAGETYWSLGLPAQLQQILAALEAASRAGRAELVLYRISELVGGLVKEFGQVYDEASLNRSQTLLEQLESAVDGVRKLVKEEGEICWSPLIPEEKWKRGHAVIEQVYFTEEELQKWGVTEEQLTKILPAAIAAGLPHVRRQLQRDFGKPPEPPEAKPAKSRTHGGEASNH